MRLKSLIGLGILLIFGFSSGSQAQPLLPMETYVYGSPMAMAPYGSSLMIPAVPSANASTMEKIPASSFATLNDTQSLSNKTLVSPTIAGSPLFTGLSPGTQVSCLGLTSANILVLSAAACGTGNGTPGGSAGQIQFNNSGTFGGFTVGGDATLNTATGALTVTKTNGVSFGALATENAVTPTQLPNSGVTAGCYTLGSYALTVDATGRITNLVSGACGAASLTADNGSTILTADDGATALQAN